MTEPPPIVLETDRLSLRLASPAEAEAVVDYFARNREHFARWDPRKPPGFYDPAFWRQRLAIEAQGALADRGYRLFVLERDDPARIEERSEVTVGRHLPPSAGVGMPPRSGATGRIVGQVHFANIVRGAFHCCHLGFSIDRQLEGRGLMHEALTRAIAFAFDDLKLHRIEANHRPENVRSARLLRRLSFVPQGYARDYLRIDGEWRDHVLTALVNERWTEDDGVG